MIYVALQHKVCFTFARILNKCSKLRGTYLANDQTGNFRAFQFALAKVAKGYG
jgi:hypothetical protein